MKRALFAIAAMIAASAGAVHVQIGFSGHSNLLARYLEEGTLYSPSTPWFDGWVELGATPSHVAENDFLNGHFGCWIGGQWSGESGSGPYGAFLEWLPSNPWRVYIGSTGYTGTSGSAWYIPAVTLGETVSVPEYGYYNAYVDRRVTNGILTMRGDPYSLIVNDTNAARTFNGVEIPAGGAASLPFPFHISTSEITGVKFYDLESGDEVTPYNYGAYGTTASGGYYHINGYYTPAWTGNLRISDGTGSTTNMVCSVENLIYDDITSAGEDKLLYGTNGVPVYAGTVTVTTNFYVMTEWQFDESTYGADDALINGEVVCHGHSTTHIIAYTVSTEGMRVNEMNGIGTVDFTMSIVPGSGSAGGACVFRCWNREHDSYDAAPASQRASISGTHATTARFRVTVNTRTGVWTLAAR